jgi:hypothetical protein
MYPALDLYSHQNVLESVFHKMAKEKLGYLGPKVKIWTVHRNNKENNEK